MLLDLIIPVIVFTLFIILITFVVTISYKLLTPQHKVKIRINKSRTHSVQAGTDILSALQQNDVLLPSSCGGKGTCGLCRCQLFPSPTPLAIEKSFLSPKELSNGVRLACQHHLNVDLDLTVDDAVLNAQKFTVIVKATKQLSNSIKELTFVLPHLFSYRPGDYILIEIPSADNEPITRAYSISSFPGEGKDELKLTVSFAISPDPRHLPDGVGTTFLFSLNVGDEIKISGPFGNFHLQQSENEKCFIGGGAGMAPLRSQINALLKDSTTEEKVSFWYGARSAKELIYCDEMTLLSATCLSFTFHTAVSEEPVVGASIRYIHEEVYKSYLKDHKSPEDVEYYLCGPALMIEATIAMLYSVGVDDDMIFFDNFG